MMNLHKIISLIANKMKLRFNYYKGDQIDHSTSTALDVKSQGSVASGSTDSGNPIKIGGVYNTTPPTLTNGQRGDAQMDASANLKVTQATTIAGEDITNDVLKVEQRTLYLNGSTSQLVKTGAGKFFGFVINSHSSGTLKFWDNTSAATTILLNTITFAAGPATWVLPVGIQFSTGLYVTVGGTIDYTILYQ